MGKKSAGSSVGRGGDTWTLHEQWWRAVRDDFCVRIDELTTATRTKLGTGPSRAPDAASRRSGGVGSAVPTDMNAALRMYTMECATCLQVYFSYRFMLQNAGRHDWVMKEVRSLLSSVTQLLFMSSQLNLHDSELTVFILLGQAMSEALTNFNDAGIPRLRSALDEAGLTLNQKQQATLAEKKDPNRSFATSDASLKSGKGSLQEVQLSRFRQTYQQRAAEIRELRMSSVISQIQPQNLRDAASPQRRVLEKLLLLCGSQRLSSDECVVFVLQLLRFCLTSAPAELKIPMQNAFGDCQSLRVGTVLLDSTNKDVVFHALQLAIATLDGGNRTIQDQFLRYLVSNDERFFSSCKRTLESGALELVHMRKLRLSNAGDVFTLDRDAAAFPLCVPLLRTIQLLCEGHHYQLQEYCREQRDNLKSVNAVQFIVSFLSVLLNGPYNEIETSVLQAFSNLTEFCQGPCHGNQSILLSSEATRLIDRVLRSPNARPCVKHAAVTTLISMIEGRTDTHVAQSLLRQLPLETLQRLFLETAKSSHATSAHADADDEVGLLFDVGVLLRTLADLLGPSNPMQLRITQVLASRADVASQTGRVQIERDEHLELVYFRIPPSCQRIREESKERLLWEVDRSSQSAKHSSFHDHCENLIVELDVVAAMENTIFQWSETIRSVTIQRFIRERMYPSTPRWVFMSVVTAMTSNFLLICGVRFFVIHQLLGLLQLAISVMVAYLDWTIAGTVYIHRFRKRRQREVQRKTLTSANSPSFKPNQPTSDHTNSENNDRTTSAANVQQQGSTLNRLLTKLSLYEGAGTLENDTLLWRKVCRSSFAAANLMILSAVLGLIISPNFFAVHLFWTISLSPSLKNVVAAVTQNKRTLAVTLFLGALFIYAFSLVGFALFPDDFDTDDDESSRENCNSLFHCFVYLAVVGLRQGGGVGDVMKNVPWGSTHFVGRRLFDFAYFSIMIVVFLNILFGIIIDTFAELRDAKHDKEQDMRLKCFVCGISSHVFDQYGEGFVQHTKGEHNMWQYLFFLQHLKLKDSNDYTGQESYVALKLSRKDFSFFPTRSLALEERMRLTDSSHLLRGARGEGGDDDSDENVAGGSSGNVAVARIRSEEGSSSGSAGGHITSSSHEVQLLIASIRDEARSHYEELRGQVKRIGEGYGRMTAMSRFRPGDTRTLAGSLLLGGGPAIELRDAGIQTTFSTSVATLEHDLKRALTEAAAHRQESLRLHEELRRQVEEIRQLQRTAQSVHELQLSASHARSEARDLERQLDLAVSDKDVVVRQNIFLQQEVDRLVVENTRLSAAAKAYLTKHAVERYFAKDRNTEVSDASLLPSGVVESLPVLSEFQTPGSELRYRGTSIPQGTSNTADRGTLSSLPSLNKVMGTSSTTHGLKFLLSEKEKTLAEQLLERSRVFDAMRVEDRHPPSLDESLRQASEAYLARMNKKKELNNGNNNNNNNSGN